MNSLQNIIPLFTRRTGIIASLECSFIRIKLETAFRALGYFSRTACLKYVPAIRTDNDSRMFFLFPRNNMIFEQMNVLSAGNTFYFSHPEIIHHIGFSVTRRAFSLVVLLDLVRYISLQSFERLFQFVGIDWLKFLFHSPPCNRVDIDPDGLCTQAVQFHQCGSATHEWIKNDFV